MRQCVRNRRNQLAFFARALEQAAASSDIPIPFGLAGWAYRIRTAESGGELPDWICVSRARRRSPSRSSCMKPNCSSGASCLMTTYQLASPHSNSIVRPACDKCGTKMRLVGIEMSVSAMNCGLSSARSATTSNEDRESRSVRIFVVCPLQFTTNYVQSTRASHTPSPIRQGRSCGFAW